MIGETLVYELGQQFGSKVLELRLIKRLFKPEKVESIRLRLQGSEKKVMRSIRFVPAFRPHVLLCASALGLSRKTFYRYNSILIAVYVVLIVGGTNCLTHVIDPTPAIIGGVMAAFWILNWFIR